jgi:hypothetical protein
MQVDSLSAEDFDPVEERLGEELPPPRQQALPQIRA